MTTQWARWSERRASDVRVWSAVKVLASFTRRRRPRLLLLAAADDRWDDDKHGKHLRHGNRSNWSGPHPNQVADDRGLSMGLHGRSR